MSLSKSFCSLLPRCCHLCGSPTRRKPFCPLCRFIPVNKSAGRCSQCFSRSGVVRCVQCVSSPLPYTQTAFPFDYEGLGVEIIQKIKFERNRVLRDWALKRLYQFCQKNMDFSAFDSVTSVPSSSYTLKQSDIDFPRFLARSFSRNYSLDSLDLQFHPQSQVLTQHHLSSERRVRRRQQFVLGRKSLVRGKNVLLIDDVCTSGTSAENASSYLTKQGASAVFFLCLARSRTWSHIRFTKTQE
jgi:competence protein ComFC